MDKSGDTQSSTIAREMGEIPALLFSRKRFPIFEEGSLTPPQISLLQKLWSNPDGMKMSDLAREMHTSMPSATGMVSRLVEKKFIARRDDISDRRIVIVSITTKGAGVLKRFHQDVERIWSDLLSDFTKKEKEDFLRLITKVKKILKEDQNA